MPAGCTRQGNYSPPRVTGFNLNAYPFCSAIKVKPTHIQNQHWEIQELAHVQTTRISYLFLNALCINHRMTLFHLTVVQQGHIKLAKLRNIYANKCCSFERSINQITLKKYIMISIKILNCTTIFKILKK